MKTNIAINLAQEPFDVDIDRLAFLLTELDKIHHESVPERFPLYSLEKRKEDIHTILKQGYLFYVSSHSQIVGFASVLKRNETLMIEHLYIQPNFRHQKAATKVVKSIFEKFPKQDIFASTYAFNVEAIMFYENLFELSSLVFKRKGKN